MARARETSYLFEIDSKLKSGIALSAEEMNHLKENNPELYENAVEVMKERAAYKKQLESAQTKDEVHKLNTYKMQEFVSEIKTIKANPNIALGKKVELIDQIGRVAAGVCDEYTKFVDSARYANLPAEKEDNKLITSDSNKEDTSFEDVKKFISSEINLKKPPKLTLNMRV